MNRGKFLFAILCCVCSDLTAAELGSGTNSYSCEYTAPKRGSSGSVSIEVKNGSIQVLSFHNFFKGLPGNMGYSCLIETTRGDSDPIWSDKLNQVEIKYADAEDYADGDSIFLTMTTDQIILDLSKTISSGKCGAGAELPQKVTLLKSGGTC